jgi:hypothetical protein
LRKNTVAFILLIVFSVVLASGCGSSDPPPAAIVSPFRAEVPRDVGSKKITTVETDFYIDAINGKPHNNKSVIVAKGSIVTFGGWAVDRSRKVVPKTIYVKLTAETGGKEYYVKADRAKRLDVVKVFNINEYENAGFNAVGDTKELAPGNYTVGILQIDDAQAIAFTSNIQIVLQ